MGNSAEDQPLEGTIEEAEHRRAVPEHARQAYFMAEAANLVRQLADKPQLRSVFGWSLTVIASAPSSLIAANWQSVVAGGLISYWAQSLDPVRSFRLGEEKVSASAGLPGTSPRRRVSARADIGAIGVINPSGPFLTATVRHG